MNPLPVISVTEVLQFRNCRRQWHLSNVVGLQPRVRDRNLWIGEGIHQALEAYWNAIMFKEFDKAVANAQYRLRAWYLSQEADLKSALGDAWGEAEPEFLLMIEMGEKILVNFNEFNRGQAVEWVPVEVERRWQVPIKGRDGRTLKDTPVLSARMDLVAREAVEGALTPTVTVVDNKTMRQKQVHTGEPLDLDEQGTGYVYSYWRRTGTIAKFAYQALLKKVPKDPQINKDGSVSVNKMQDTVYDLYLSTMFARGLPTNDPKYSDMLEVLREKGWSNFFYREETFRNESQLRNYEERLYVTYKEMREAALDPSVAYPAPGPFKCKMCPYIKVCHAMEDGGDYEAIVQNEFKVEFRDKSGELIADAPDQPDYVEV